MLSAACWAIADRVAAPLQAPLRKRLMHLIAGFGLMQQALGILLLILLLLLLHGPKMLAGWLLDGRFVGGSELVLAFVEKLRRQKIDVQEGQLLLSQGLSSCRISPSPVPKGIISE